METSFHYDLQQKQLGFKLRERITARGGLEVKGNGIFNTVTGSLDYRATLKCKVHKGLRDVDAGTSPLTLGLGLAATSSKREEPLLTASAKKTLSLLDGPNTVLSAKATGDYDIRAQQYKTWGTFKVSHKMKGFTKRQDLKLSLGADVAMARGDRQPKPELLFQVRENNWALHYRHNKWFATYDL